MSAYAFSSERLALAFAHEGFTEAEAQRVRAMLDNPENKLLVSPSPSQAGLRPQPAPVLTEGEDG